MLYNVSIMVNLWGALTSRDVRLLKNQIDKLDSLPENCWFVILNAMGAEVVFNHADYRLLSARVLQEFAEFGEVNLFLRGMIPLVGFKSTTVTYERHERIVGESHYPLSKMLALAIDGITSLSIKPLRVITAFGVLVAAISFVGVIWALTSVLRGNAVSGWGSMTCIICFVSGVQLICMGVMGEYIGKICHIR